MARGALKRPRATHSALVPPAARDPLAFPAGGWTPGLILAALAAVFFRNILLGTSFFWEDFLYQNYPFRNFAAVSMAMGQMPLWNPYTFSGMPFLADIQTTVFYLPCTALAFFVRGGILSPYWLEIVIILHYPLAGMGMFALARSFSVKRGSALFAAVAYAFSGFMITHVIHQQMVTLVAWYPLILLLFRRILAEGRWGWVFLTAAVIGHSILAGFPQLSLYFYFFLLTFFLFEMATTWRGKALLSRQSLLAAARVAVTIVLSVAIAMIQLLPTLELSQLSQRAEITYEKSLEGILSWSQLVTFVYPKFFGSATAGNYAYWGPGTYWYYWETCVYLGILPLLLALLTFPLLKRSKYVAFFWGWAAFALLYALGDGFVFHRWFFEFVPGFSKFRNPARMGIFVAFAASLLASFSLDSIFAVNRERRTRFLQRNVLFGVTGFGILFWILAVSGSLTSTFPALQNPQTFAAMKRDILPSLIVLLLSSGLLLIALFGRWRLPHAGIIFSAVLFLDMLVFGETQIGAKLNPADYFSRTRAVTSAFQREGMKEFFRVNSRNSQGLLLDRNQGMIDRVFLTEGYTPLALQRVFPVARTTDQMLDLLNVKYKTVAEGDRRLAFAPHPSYLPRAFFVYNIHVARDETELTAYLQSPAFDHRTTAVLERDPGVVLSPGPIPPSSRASILTYENNMIRLDVETSQEGILVLSEIFFPGWKATIDGTDTEVYRTDYSLRGVVVPRGRHVVEMRFAPGTFRNGMLVSGASLLLCAAGLGVSLRRPRQTPVSNQQPPGGS